MPLPKIIKTETLAATRFFKIEAMHLEFSTGEQRVYERLPAGASSGVIVVAINENDELMLIREYAAGFHEFQLTLPKGAVDQGETLEVAADRELAEEIGFAAREIEFVCLLRQGIWAIRSMLCLRATYTPKFYPVMSLSLQKWCFGHCRGSMNYWYQINLMKPEQLLR